MKSDSTAIIYLRVSTKKQADNDLPLESQLKKCEEKVEVLQSLNLRTFEDRGLSGRSSNRPAFLDAIEYCEDHKITYFVTWSSSRFSRNALEAKMYKLRLKKNGTKLIYAGMEMPKDDFSNFLQDSFLELIDEMVSRQVSKDTRRSMELNAQSGHFNGGRVPYGYDVVPDKNDARRRRLSLNELESVVVKKVFDLRLQGDGAQRISDRLNEEGISRRGKKWDKKTVLTLLRNEKVKGCSVFGRKDHYKNDLPKDEWIVVQSHEPIIESKTFERVQVIMDAASGNAGSGVRNGKFLFTGGLLRCGKCKGILAIDSGTSRNGSLYHYYVCQSNRKKLGCDSKLRLPAADLDSWMAEMICKDVFVVENLRDLAVGLKEFNNTHVKAAQKTRNALNKQFKKLEAQRERIYDYMFVENERAADLPDIDQVRTRLKKLNDEIRILEKDMRVIDAKPAPSKIKLEEHDLLGLADVFTNAVLDSKHPGKVREFFSQFIESIVIDGDSVELNYLPAALLSGAESDRFVLEGSWLPDRPTLRTPKKTSSVVKTLHYTLPTFRVQRRAPSAILRT